MKPDTHTWLPIDTTTVLPATDQDLHARLGRAINAAQRHHLALPGTLHAIRNAKEGQPQAANTDPRNGPTPWCWTHDQTIDRCDNDNNLCAGEAITGPNDPTGNAALTPDRAAADERELRRLAETIIRSIDRLDRLTAAWPTALLELDDEPATPGDLWCRSCWRDARHCQPIEHRPDGTPYYAGLCRWCGQTRKHLANEDPPLWLVQMKHRGQRINDGHLVKAKAEVKRKKRKKRKSA